MSCDILNHLEGPHMHRLTLSSHVLKLLYRASSIVTRGLTVCLRETQQGGDVHASSSTQMFYHTVFEGHKQAEQRDNLLPSREQWNWPLSVLAENIQALCRTD